ncbi:MAG: SET domain-containing protein [Verrucomicrobia bacterium]|nr:SET domain-containing protein [Verrucomicrobiota bacterium]
MLLIQTRVAPSTIHGLGLFTIGPVKRGTPVWRFEPGFDRDFSPEQFAALPPLAREHTRWFAFVSKADGHLIRSGDHACFMNHSPAPNTGAPVDATAPVTTVALRDLAADEELTCDYWTFDADAPWKLGQVPRAAPLGAGPTRV